VYKKVCKLERELAAARSALSKRRCDYPEHAAALKAKEEAERDVEQLKQSISLALTQMSLAHKYPPEAAKETLESAFDEAMKK